MKSSKPFFNTARMPFTFQEMIFMPAQCKASTRPAQAHTSFRTSAPLANPTSVLPPPYAHWLARYHFD
jgi:hypothetical protein